MNRKTRASHRVLPFLKYLKPGALAQIRDSRITARSHRIVQIRSPTPSLASPASVVGQPSLEGFPCFAGRAYGPRCPMRKKLVAAKLVIFTPSSPVLVDASDPMIDLFGGDIVVH